MVFLSAHGLCIHDEGYVYGVIEKILLRGTCWRLEIAPKLNRRMPTGMKLYTKERLTRITIILLQILICYSNIRNLLRMFFRSTMPCSK